MENSFSLEVREIAKRAYTLPCYTKETAGLARSVQSSMLFAINGRPLAGHLYLASVLNMQSILACIDVTLLCKRRVRQNYCVGGVCQQSTVCLSNSCFCFFEALHFHFVCINVCIEQKGVSFLYLGNFTNSYCTKGCFH